MEFHSQSKQELLQTLHSSGSGLSQEEAKLRLAKYGLNVYKLLKRMKTKQVEVAQ